MKDTHHGFPGVTCKGLRMMQNEEKQHRILDVRDLAEYEAGHVEGSLHVPHDELEGNIESLITDKEHTIVVIIGEEPDHAKQVHSHLTKAGYKDVRFLIGGFNEWCKPAVPDIEDVLQQIKEEDALHEEKPEHHQEEEDPNDAEPMM